VLRKISFPCEVNFTNFSLFITSFDSLSTLYCIKQKEPWGCIKRMLPSKVGSIEVNDT